MFDSFFFEFFCWLYSIGKKEEVSKFLEKVVKYNGKDIFFKFFDDIDIGKKEVGKIWLFFFDCCLGVRIVIIFYNW